MGVSFLNYIRYSREGGNPGLFSFNFLFDTILPWPYRLTKDIGADSAFDEKAKELESFTWPYRLTQGYRRGQRLR